MPDARANIKPNTNKVLMPTAYVLDSIILTNHRGRQADIQHLVTDFSITESLYTAAMILKLNVKDAANFIEEYELLGQETIEIKLSRQDYNEKDVTKLALFFYVTEYPIYGRGKQEHTHAYSITAISKHAYLSQFKRISRAVNGLISDEIYRILSKDLFVPDVAMSIEPTVERFNGVLPLMHPLDSAYWLLRRAYDRNSCPFFLHESLSGGIRLESLTTLIDDKSNPNYRTFDDFELKVKTPGSREFFDDCQRGIEDLSSNFRLSKVLPMLKGAFSSRNIFLDLSTKSIINKVFSYSEISPELTLNKNTVLSESFGVPYTGANDIRSLSDMPDASVEYVPINSLAYSTDASKMSYHDMMVQRLGKYNAIVETLDTFIQEITVPGDLNLRSGQKVTLEIPKAIDPRSYVKKNGDNNSDDRFDQMISGKYLITAIIHQFGSEYHCRMRLKRDSLTFDVNKG